MPSIIVSVNIHVRDAYNHGILKSLDNLKDNSISFTHIIANIN